MNKYNINDIGGIVAKEDDRYRVCDNSELKNLVLSSTDLHPNKSTSGHEHPGQEEIYFFIKGSGEMEINDRKFNVSEGALYSLKMVISIEYMQEIVGAILFVYLMGKDH